MSDRIECRTDFRAIFEAAFRAGALSPLEPWMYMYSFGRQHYFKHSVTRRYQVWVGTVDPPAEPLPSVSASGSTDTTEDAR